jgi:hypothetical protein
MTSTDDPALRDRRLDLVRLHMQSENDLDFETTMATFAHPRYELVATGQVYDGPDEVAEYYRTSRSAESLRAGRGGFREGRIRRPRCPRRK